MVLDRSSRLTSILVETVTRFQERAIGISWHGTRGLGLRMALATSLTALRLLLCLFANLKSLHRVPMLVAFDKRWRLRHGRTFYSLCLAVSELGHGRWQGICRSTTACKNLQLFFLQASFLPLRYSYLLSRCSFLTASHSLIVSRLWSRILSTNIIN